MFGLSSSKNAQCGVIIDVASGSIGFALVVSDESAKDPEIICASREYIKAQPHKLRPEQHQLRVKQALFSAALAFNSKALPLLQQKYPKQKVTSTFVTCSAPWSHTVSRTVSCKDDTDFTIDEDVIADITKKAESEIESTAHESEIAASSGFRIVERATTNITINGYSVRNLTELKGKEVSLYHTSGMVSTELYNIILEIHEKLFPGSRLRIHTSMLAHFCTLHDAYQDCDSFLVYSVTGEATEIGLIQNDALIATKSVSCGINTVVRAIQKATGGTHEHAQSILRAYHEHTAGASSESIVETHLASYKETLSNALSGLAESHALPKHLSVLSFNEYTPFFTQIIPDIHAKIVGNAELLKQPALISSTESDPFLNISSRFFHKSYVCGEDDITK